MFILNNNDNNDIIIIIIIVGEVLTNNVSKMHAYVHINVHGNGEKHLLTSSNTILYSSISAYNSYLDVYV